jgi:hypothetical protein
VAVWATRATVPHYGTNSRPSNLRTGKKETIIKKIVYDEKPDAGISMLPSTLLRGTVLYTFEIETLTTR